MKKLMQKRNSIVARMKRTYSDLRIIIVMSVTHHAQVLLTPCATQGDLVFDSNKVHDRLTGNTWITTTDPTMAVFQTQIQDLEKAITSVKKKEAGARAIREQAQLKLEHSREKLRAAVEIVAINNPGHEEEIAQSAGMRLKSHTGKSTQDFSVKPTIDGLILAGKPKAKRCAHEWGTTLDITAEINWYKNPVPTTLKGKTIVTGYNSGELVYCRHRCILDTGPSEWDQIISIRFP